MGDGDKLVRQLGHHLSDARAIAAVKGGHRFVEHDGSRGHDDHRQDAEQLLFAAAEQMGGLPAFVREIIAPQQIVHARAHLVFRHVQVARTKGEVFLHRRHHDLVLRVLKHEADRRARRRGVPAGGDTVDQYLAGSRDKQSVQHPRERALARAVVADDRDAPPGQPQVHPAQHGNPVEVMRNAAQLDDRWFAHSGQTTRIMGSPTLVTMISNGSPSRQ